MHIAKKKLIKAFQINDERKFKEKRNTTPARDSNIELLRIFSMILIVAHHFSLHGVLKEFPENPLANQSVTSFLAQVIQSGGKAGVTLFIIISGYFMVQSNMKVKKYFYYYFKFYFTQFWDSLLLQY